MVIYLTNSNKVGKIYNVDIKTKYLSLLEKKINILILHFTLIKRNQKTCKFGIYLKINLGMYHKNKIYLRKKINVDVILSKIAMLKKYCEFF